MEPETHRYANSSETAYGWHTRDGLQHIASVANGLSCDCVCLACGHTLVASQGQINAWHFKHKARADCPGGTILLRAARIMLLEAAARGESLGVPALQIIEAWRTSASFLKMYGGRELEASRYAALARLDTDGGTINVAIVNRDQNRRGTDDTSPESDALLEIDISSLSALTQPKALHDAVLRTAVRRWAIQPAWRSKEPKPPAPIGPTADRQMPAGDGPTSSDAPHNYQEILKTVLAFFKTPGSLSDERIEWPVGHLLAGQTSARMRVQLRSVAITNAEPRSPVYRTSGQIVGDAGYPMPTDVWFAFAGDSATKRAKPGTLIVHCPDSVDDGNWPSRLHIEWRPAKTKPYLISPETQQRAVAILANACCDWRAG